MGEVTGDQWAEVVHPDDLEWQQRAYSQNMSARREFHLEYRICPRGPGIPKDAR